MELNQRKIIPLLKGLLFVAIFVLCAPASYAQDSDSTDTDSPGDIELDEPSNIQTVVEYDPLTNQYIVYRKIGDMIVSTPQVMTPEEYEEFIYEQQDADYWGQKSGSGPGRGNLNDPSGGNSLLPSLNVNNEAFDKIFGGDAIEIIPRGSAELIFSGMFQKTDNPSIPERNRSTATFNFDQKIQMNVVGRIGDKLELSTNYDTEATFQFENKMKLDYEGDEDEIIQRLELGDVSLPLNSSLIQGAQSLFGVKGQFKFGNATVTSVFSEQRSESSNIKVEGGARTQEFELRADNYEANRHFFLTQMFRDFYDEALVDLPVVRSQVKIVKIEVWVTNRTAQTDNVRNIVGFMDLAEPEVNNQVIIVDPTAPPVPHNGINSLDPPQMAAAYPGIRNMGSVNVELNAAGYREGIDYVDLGNARKLKTSEYQINDVLGYISLNQSLNQDEVLAVAFQYTFNGETFQVGEFSTDGVEAPENLIVKMLKSNQTNVGLPLWDLMMKNIYSIGAFQVNREDFRMDVLYANDQTGIPINFLPEGSFKDQILLRVMNLDRLNNNNDPQPDGVFDFITGLTINPSNGRIIFPVVEPFGSHLRAQFEPGEEELTDKYVYQSLYDSSLFVAQQDASRNKFFLKGSYKSSSGAEIPLNAMNIPQGSVRVTAGGQTLVENQHYTVDYTLGRVTILDEGLLNSGVPINISLENNSLFAVNTKRFIGTQIDYKVSDDLMLGGSFLNLSERPLTYKVNSGQEPINNTIWGVQGNYTKDSRWLTKMVDALPGIETKAKSNINVSGEFAHLIPGSARGIRQDGQGVSYIDDFENTQSTIDIRNVSSWKLASVPQYQPELFPEADIIDGQEYGFNRARMAWYVVDPIFYQNNSLTPEHIRNDQDQQSNHYVREVLVQEIFPNRSIPSGQPSNLAVLNMAYYPEERGPYNFDVEPSQYSAGLNDDGSLASPKSRWAGIMREVRTSNFETANIEFIQFWVLDPFIYDQQHSGGDLYFNLGNISEDILRDGRNSYENGLPNSDVVQNVDTTAWGRISTNQAIVYAFDNDPSARAFQDLGIDGLNTNDEKGFAYDGVPGNLTYLDRIQQYFGTTANGAYESAEKDPAADDYHYYRGTDYDNDEVTIWDRYKLYNLPEGNSPTDEQSPESYPTAFSPLPDVEDINKDFTLSKAESYYQYRVSMRTEDFRVGQNFITDSITTSVRLQNGDVEQVTWYQFKVPVFEPDHKVGAISDFRSIRFMRMFMKGFDSPLVLRFASLEFVRGDWRRYLGNLNSPSEDLDDDSPDDTEFDVLAVNLEENGARSPILYVEPPGVDREILFATTDLQQLNEQSLAVRLCELEDGDARAVWKSTDLDLRQYNRLKMFIHAESRGTEEITNDDDVWAFIRIGTDFTENYYEYAIPLKMTPWGSGDPQVIWPKENEFDFLFEELHNVKLDRNDAMEVNSDVNYTTLYSKYFGSHRISVIGNPSTGNARVLMLGIRNPKKRSPEDSDDGLSKCTEVWFNELRLTDFDEKGGWAATARAVAKLADFGTVSVSGRIETIGFGSIEKRVQERNMDELRSWDMTSSFELGKFFGDQAGIRVPVYFAYGEDFSNPKFNPLDPDIELKEYFDRADDTDARKEIKEFSQTYTRRKSLNFTNVRKERGRGGGGRGGDGPGLPGQGGGGGGGSGGSGKSRFYDIENFALSYSYTELYRRNPTTQHDLVENHRAQLAYNWTTQPKNVKPFNQVSLFRKSNWFALLRDLNFYYMPSKVSFRMDARRMYSENLLRNNSDAFLLIDTNYNKAFTLDRLWDVKWDIARGLKLDYSARSNNRIDEPYGAMDSHARDSMWTNFWNGGRSTQFHQDLNINWNIPINKIPLLDWTNANLRYTASYDWQAASLVVPEFGNIIQNSNTTQLNGQANFTQLYNKVPYLRKINSGGGRRQLQRNRASQTEGTEEEEEEEKKGNGTGKKIGDEVLKFLMMTKNFSLTYSENAGTALPGYLPSVDFIGMANSNGTWTPTLGFVFGSQRDIRNEMGEQGFFTRDTTMNNLFSQTRSRNANYRLNLEPFKDLRIEINGTYQEGYRYQSLYRWDNQLGEYQDFSPVESGNITTSYLLWPTAFEPFVNSNASTDDKFNSNAFDTFLSDRQTIAWRLAGNGAVDSDGDGYPDGYGATSQEVMLNAFLTAYGGQDASSYDIKDPLRRNKIPAPNWRINFDGLIRLKWFKDNFRNVTLSHAYRSTYSVSNFQTDLRYTGFQDSIDATGNYVAQYQIQTATLSEQFSPLLKIDVAMLNSWSFRTEFKRSRNLTLSLNNNQLTEIKTSDFVIGTGYRFKDVSFFVRSAGKKKKITSDLDVKADVTVRRSLNVVRRIVEENVQPTNGQTIYTIKLTGDYVISQRFSIRVFYDQILTSYEVSTSLPTSNTNLGVSLRFSIGG